jgi:hypothetical protein
MQIQLLLLTVMLHSKLFQACHLAIIPQTLPLHRLLHMKTLIFSMILHHLQGPTVLLHLQLMHMHYQHPAHPTVLHRLRKLPEGAMAMVIVLQELATTVQVDELVLLVIRRPTKLMMSGHFSPRKQLRTSVTSACEVSVLFVD